MVRVAEEWLATCGGCEVTILDIGEPLLELLPKQEIFDTVYRKTKSTDAGDTPATDIPPLEGQGIRGERGRQGGCAVAGLSPNP